MLGDEGEKRCVGMTMSGNEILLIDSINCLVLKKVEVRYDFQ
jgi:hypothetical protein